MIRVAIVFLAAFYLGSAFAEDIQKVQTLVPSTETAVDQTETVTVNHDLAAHMGWGDQQAVFKAPRSFRTKQLNELSPESLDDGNSSETNN
jgi:hypothetical protein